MKRRGAVFIICTIFIISSVVFHPSGNSRAAVSGIGNPVISADGVTTWDAIYFGSYWQADTNKDGAADERDDKEKIKWRVLSIDGDQVLLLADQCLDSQPYHSSWDNITWENSALRLWLNSTFFKEAFTKEEQESILTTEISDSKNYFGGSGADYTVQDEVFLMSVPETENSAYGFSNDYSSADSARMAGYTDYAARQSGKKSDWWLRSSGAQEYGAAYVYAAGQVTGYGSDNREKMGIRPMIRVDLSKQAVWSVAGKVKSTDAPETDQKEPEKKDPPSQDPAQTVTPNPDHTAEDTKQPSSVTDKENIEGKKENKALPAKVTSVTLKYKKKKTITVKWKKVQGARGYELQYGRSRNFKRSVTKTKILSGTTYTIRKLKRKKVYYVRMRAYQKNGNKKLYGSWSKVKKKTVKK